MNSKKNDRERDDGSCSTRRDFNLRLTALLIIACTPLRIGSGSSSNRGRWILNERDQ
jgi:hypothetical protein